MSGKTSASFKLGYAFAMAVTGGAVGAAIYSIVCMIPTN